MSRIDRKKFKTDLVTNSASTAVTKPIENFYDMLDPILEPIKRLLINIVTWFHNRFSRHRLPRPRIMRESEYDFELMEEEAVLLIP